jgi:hypothetical protein
VIRRPSQGGRAGVNRTDTVISHIHEREIGMAYEVPATTTRPGRPTVVTAAVACLFVLAGVQLISAIVTVISYGPMLDAARDYAGGTSEGDTIVATLQIGRYGGLAIAALFAIGYAVLGIFTNRGKNPARIVAWVVLGIGLCCNAGSLVSTALGGALSPGGNANSNSSIDPEELQRRMEAALPGWANAVSYILLTVSLIAALSAIILLALPAANEFFRKVEPVWEPPVPGAVYPAGAAAGPAMATPADMPPPAAAPAPAEMPPPAPAADAAPPARPDGTAPAGAEEPVKPTNLEKPADSNQPPGGFTPPA